MGSVARACSSMEDLPDEPLSEILLKLPTYGCLLLGLASRHLQRVFSSALPLLRSRLAPAFSNQDFKVEIDSHDDKFLLFSEAFMMDLAKAGEARILGWALEEARPPLAVAPSLLQHTAAHYGHFEAAIEVAKYSNINLRLVEIQNLVSKGGLALLRRLEAELPHDESLGLIDFETVFSSGDVALIEWWLERNPEFRFNRDLSQTEVVAESGSLVILEKALERGYVPGRQFFSSALKKGYIDLVKAGLAHTETSCNMEALCGMAAQEGQIEFLEWASHQPTFHGFTSGRYQSKLTEFSLWGCHPDTTSYLLSKGCRLAQYSKHIFGVWMDVPAPRINAMLDLLNSLGRLDTESALELAVNNRLPIGTIVHLRRRLNCLGHLELLLQFSLSHLCFDLAQFFIYELSGHFDRGQALISCFMNDFHYGDPTNGRCLRYLLRNYPPEFNAALCDEAAVHLVPLSCFELLKQHGAPLKESNALCLALESGEINLAEQLEQLGCSLTKEGLAEFWKPLIQSMGAIFVFQVFGFLSARFPAQEMVRLGLFPPGLEWPQSGNHSLSLLPSLSY